MLSPDGVRLDLERRAKLYRQRDARSEAAKQRREEVLNALQTDDSETDKQRINKGQSRQACMREWPELGQSGAVSV
jgi:beta-lactamase class A